MLSEGEIEEMTSHFEDKSLEYVKGDIIFPGGIDVTLINILFSLVFENTTTKNAFAHTDGLTVFLTIVEIFNYLSRKNFQFKRFKTKSVYYFIFSETIGSMAVLPVNHLKIIKLITKFHLT